MQKNNAFNIFYFYPNFFSYRFLQNLKKLCDPNKSRIILMAETIKNQFFKKKNSYKHISEFGINLFILKNWKWLSCRESFS